MPDPRPCWHMPGNGTPKKGTLPEASQYPPTTIARCTGCKQLFYVKTLEYERAWRKLTKRKSKKILGKVIT